MSSILQLSPQVAWKTGVIFLISKSGQFHYYAVNVKMGYLSVWAFKKKLMLLFLSVHSGANTDKLCQKDT